MECICFFMCVVMDFFFLSGISSDVTAAAQMETGLYFGKTL